jgi:hypothetical protein
MKYTLITKQGKVYTFYVKAVAEIYQNVAGDQLSAIGLLVDSIPQKTV